MAVLATGDGARDAVEDATRRLRGWHARLTRFDPRSELSHLNSDPRPRVPASPILCRFAAAAVAAASRTGGLVDPTLVGEIEAAGYRTHLRGGLPLAASLRLAPRRQPARPDPRARWRQVVADVDRGVVSRPHGVRLDTGGIAKGLFADILADRLAGQDAFVVDCCGDLRLGGADGLERTVQVDDPFGRGVLHEFELREGGVATSGIGRRSWIAAGGRPAHHLIDPSTGLPAYTGVVQATAIAPTAAEAEYRAKAALLSGPAAAPGWLGHGGAVVFDDGSHHVVER